MTAVVRVARACALAERDILYVNVIAGLTLATASYLLLHYGSFARALAAIGVSPAS